VLDSAPQERQPSGEFVALDGERWYAIRHVDRLSPFFISVVSSADHWLYASSTGGLSAGRVSPDTALFPYVAVDKIHDSYTHTGSTTALRVQRGGRAFLWLPFGDADTLGAEISRHLYKNELGNKLRFEEIHHGLELAFRYTWATSDEFGFVRQCELENLAATAVSVDLLDGVRNILPAGTPRAVQGNASNLVDAYKWAELDAACGLALFTLYTGITDRAEPCESLRATTAFCLGLPEPVVLLSTDQLRRFLHDEPVSAETGKRGVRGAFLVSARLPLAGRARQSWQIVLDVERSQVQVVALRRRLAGSDDLPVAIAQSIRAGSAALASVVAACDGLQSTAEPAVALHHYANVLFNVLRGGLFDEHYQVPLADVVATLRHFNHAVHDRHRLALQKLPPKLGHDELLQQARALGDPQLVRLCLEYLPIRFGRRHGDPSRPWNQFSIRLRDAAGGRILSYEGNWRDIFQNWEALAWSYPAFIESFIAKFVNASTVDGHNPYRITKDGIDWEVEDPDDPWSHIGYWGDHQIVYLLKFLELSRQFQPRRLGTLLHERLFSYANVPYRIRPFAALLETPKSTVDYDHALAAQIAERVVAMGADGKLVLDAHGEVHLATLLEKLLVALLAKLGSLVIDGGIWLNTQRPEWNDANNALVGQGLSMVTLYHLRRYVAFLRELLAGDTAPVILSTEVGVWLAETAAALRRVQPLLGRGPISATARYAALVATGEAFGRYRQAVYGRGSFSGTVEHGRTDIDVLLADAAAIIDHSIATNRRRDGLYHAYNLMRLTDDAIEIDPLYAMLEGQVAALSSGALSPQEAVAVIEALYASDVYREDQHSFMLYPDRELPTFLQKSRIPAHRAATIPLLERLLAAGDRSIVDKDAEGCIRFNPDFTNSGRLEAALDALVARYGKQVDAARVPLRTLFEDVFDHQSFTGRSGGMFGFEGLGCIYWHMVSKLLLAIQENFFAAVEGEADRQVVQQIGTLYYKVRAGLGFNKTVGEFGAFPTDPYSHTPRHAGAQQPGMTGLVKEEVIARFGELGLRVQDGRVRFDLRLLRAREFPGEAQRFRYLDIAGEWQMLELPGRTLAFTWCQVPVVVRLDDQQPPSVTVTWRDGSTTTSRELSLSAADSAALSSRSGRIRQLALVVPVATLFDPESARTH
jgi:hypothetical protein